MKTNELNQLATDMKDHCEYGRTCSDCPGNVIIKEYNSTLCDISQHSDNRNQSVVDILEAVTNRRDDD